MGRNLHRGFESRPLRFRCRCRWEGLNERAGQLPLGRQGRDRHRAPRRAWASPSRRGWPRPAPTSRCARGASTDSSRRAGGRLRSGAGAAWPSRPTSHGVEDCEQVVARTSRSSAGSTSSSTTPASAPPWPRARPPEEFRRVIDVNLFGSYWMAQACARAMTRTGGAIGQHRERPRLHHRRPAPQAAYASSKAAIIGLTRDLAQQWTGRKGIRVNALAPGFFPSEMTEQYPDGYLEQMMWRVPAGRPGDPAELVTASGVPGQRRGLLHHRRRAAGGRRDADHLNLRAACTRAGSRGHD